MKKIICSIVACFIIASSFAENIATKFKDCNAYVNLPSDYSDSTKKQYPVILFIPGKGEFGDSIVRLFNYGPHKFINYGDKFEFTVNGKVEKPIVISIQPKDYLHPKLVDAILSQILSTYRIDKKRVYVTGVSAGSYIWMKYINFSPAYASRVAGVVLVSAQPSYAQVSADGTKGYKPQYFKDQNIKYWGICGTSDGFYLDQKKFAESLDEISPKSAIFTDFKGFSHDPKIWDIAFDPVWKSSTTGSNIYTWLLAINQ